MNKDFEILRINERNLNGRVYAKNIIKENIGRIGDKPIYGKIGMCDSIDLDLSEVSHIVTKLRLEENKMIGCISVMDNENGNRLIKMIEDEQVVFRPQGEGKCDKVGNIKNFKLLSVNAISKDEDAFGEK